MSNPYFQFKQFTVWHDRCAMKVNTDGVILGAWAPVENTQSVLDIGSGTGVIAIMLAQRCPDANIIGVEIEPDASTQAKENCKNSPWSHRIEIIQDDFRHFQNNCLNQFDLIVSNPPFFQQSLRNPDSKRHLARHNDSLSSRELISGVKNLLQPHGSFAVIIPYENIEIEDETWIQGLYLQQILSIRTRENKPFSRKILLFKTEKPVKIIQDTLTIHQATGAYSDDYKNLTKEFYL
jgi:tRNA1Val (adenine37-N6)-methyltransferase